MNYLLFTEFHQLSSIQNNRVERETAKIVLQNKNQVNFCIVKIILDDPTSAINATSLSKQDVKIIFILRW
jgi:hypothetical protein